MIKTINIYEYSLDMDDFKVEFYKLVEDAKSIVITSHKGPDPDAIASSLAVYHLLISKYPDKEFKVVFESKINNSFAQYPHFNQIIWTGDWWKLVEGVELVIFLDGNSLHRFTSQLESLTDNINTICLDHHQSEGGIFTIQQIDSKYMSTCHMITDLLCEDKDLNSKDLVNLLIEGIMGDSGNLTYIRKSNAAVLSTLQRLIIAGDIDLEQVKLKNEIFDDKTFGSFQELVRNTSKVMIKEAFPEVTFSYLPKDFILNLADKSTAKEPKYQGIILRHLENSPWGFVVRWNDDYPKEFNISFRSSRYAPNVRLICEKYFNGGGHNAAAGGSYMLKEREEDWDTIDVCNYILKVLKEADIELIS